MKIQIDGTNTLNKGAELMLYAVLEEIERKFPDSEIFYNSRGDGYKKIKSSLAIKSYKRFNYGIYPGIILSKLNIRNTYFTNFYPVKGIDILLDASGFRLGDQWQRDDYYVNTLRRYFSKMKEYNTKIILLPQALGPFETANGARVAMVLNDYVDLIVAREPVSYQYLVDAGVNSAKIMVSTDFTNLVKGTLPHDTDFRNQVCIIPNKKMITHTSLATGRYLSTINSVIQTSIAKGFTPFLLNHEGAGDLQLCNDINKNFGEKLQVISGLDAKGVKGVIGASYFVFSSRYHGVASSLSQCVPCLATSWSHKYKLLFNDYGLDNQIIDVNWDSHVISEKVSFLLDSKNNQDLRRELSLNQGELIKQSINMWKTVWGTLL